MKIIIFLNGKSKTYSADEVDIVTGDKMVNGALFVVTKSGDNGITVEGEINMSASFGENSITLVQPVS